ncbi:hypothetical protein RKE29_09565 [Streptomyces sp. B1866]|uniref:hypothetical protein n=1 Tax=Streptomyces sp. B1866 TaxID=3075431 RepID=UPI00288DE609|nr:hypothetical protein [Streptomyces sp. B1866]MDT3396889.1 hypothetical protein [Streptomyces sp. B1866]
MTAPVLAARARRSWPAARGRPGVPWLALVAAGYAAVQLALIVPRMRHGLGWDESVYVSQADPRRPAAFFSAPRSRGTSVLVAPVVAATSSVTVLRVVLALLASAALYAAFRTWRPLVGRGAAALAALLFAGLWITVLSGSQAMPNLWVALGAVAAVGWFLRVPAERRALVWLAALMAAVTLVRAPDGGWLALPLVAAAACHRPWRPALAALAGGLALGAAQWVYEAYDRFGGVPERLRVSSDTEGGMAPHLNTDTALRSLNGPLLCRPCDQPLEHVELTLWWLALPALAAGALAWGVRRRRVRPLGPTAVPLACAVLLAVPYLFLIDYSAPRFLLPAYALAALPLAALAVHAVRRTGRPGPAAAVLGLVFALHLSGQYGVARDNADGAAATARDYRTIAAGLRDLGLRPPCLVTGSRALPVGYAGGCASAEVAGNNRSTTASGLLRRAAREPTALLAYGRAAPPAYARGWTRHDLPGTAWTAYLAPTPDASSPRRR